MPNERLVAAEAIAEHFGVTVDTVTSWVRRRLIPCIRPSRRIVRFRLSDVERALTCPAVGAGRGRETESGKQLENQR